jgi:hypothetical protein
MKVLKSHAVLYMGRRNTTPMYHIKRQANAYNGIEMAHISHIPWDRGISRHLLIEIEGD